MKQQSESASFTIPEGSLLGLCDSNGVEFRVGSKVKRINPCNEEVHGAWVVYKVTLQGTVPLLSYFISEKGQVLPVGYTAGCLCNEYDHKMFVFATDSKSLRPDEELLIIEE